MLLIFFIFVSLKVHLAFAAFGADFRNFIHARYGPEMVHMLERTDLGKDASIGGAEMGEARYSGEPVLIVHGITNKITRFNVRIFGFLTGVE